MIDKKYSSTVTDPQLRSRVLLIREFAAGGLSLGYRFQEYYESF